MAASPRAPRSAPEEPDVLPLVTPTQRSRLGTGVAAVGILAVILVAADAAPTVRAPVVLLAALLLPGYPFVARLRLDLPTLLAVDVCTSLAVEAGLVLLAVELRLWHPEVIGLALACFGVGGTFVTLTAIRHDEARHLT
ncbi:MAG: hypothetical protein ABR549_16465 [Mycobacteriales bacterium]